MKLKVFCAAFVLSTSFSYHNLSHASHCGFNYPTVWKIYNQTNFLMQCFADSPAGCALAPKN